MLPPVYLLPATQLSPLHRLLALRSGTQVSLQYLGPATRRPDAYRDGTLTRGSGAASQGHPRPIGLGSFLNVTTHHGRNCRRSTSGLWIAPKLPAMQTTITHCHD